MRRILITGVNGFFGRNLVKAWQHQYQLTGLDYSGHSNSTREPFDPWHRQVIYQDLRQDRDIPALANQDTVIHLAAKTRITPSWNDIPDYYDTNITASQQLFRRCQQYGVKQFVYFSSSSVYGNRWSRIKETEELRPTSPYAVSKAAAEMALMAQAQMGDTELIIVRPFTMYGDFMNFGDHALAIAKFIKAKEQNEPISIEGHGRKERDFVHASDAVRALELILEHGRHKDVFNIGSGKYISIKEIADALTHQQVIVPDRVGAIDRTWADTTKIQALGFQPSVDLLDWLKVYLETYNL
jgi:nucleoside-diphosphate-sugar epimerase